MFVALGSRVRFARALRSRPFALLWTGQTISTLGDGAYLTALAWQVLLLTGSATAMGVVLVARSAPMLLFLLVGGVAADRLPRRLIMLWSDAGRGVVTLAIAALGWAHLLQLWHLVALSLLFGLVNGFFMPAYQALAPQIVETDSLASANALTSLSRSLGQLVGPVLGALLVALTGPAGAFAFDGLTFLVSALCLVALGSISPIGPIGSVAAMSPASQTVTAEGAAPRRRSPLADARDGLGYVLRSTWLWVTILIAAFANMVVSAAFGTALPKLVSVVYHANVGVLGSITAANAAGAILATLAAGQIHLRRRGALAYTALCLSSAALTLLGLPALFGAPRALLPWIAVGGAAAFGAGLGVFDVVWVTTLQELVPSDTLGRVSSIDMLGSFALLPVGYAVVGALADHIGTPLIFVGAGALTLALNLAGLCVPGIRNLP